MDDGAAASAASEAYNAAPLQTAAQSVPGAVNTGFTPSIAAMASAANPAAVGGAYQELFATTQASLQLINQTWSGNPAPLLRQVIANQQGYARTIGTAFQSAAQDFATGVAGLPAAYQAAFQAFAAGDYNAGALELGKGYLTLVFTGFDDSNVPAVTLNAPSQTCFRSPLSLPRSRRT